jgi:acyl transferase domain-containing protein
MGMMAVGLSDSEVPPYLLDLPPGEIVVLACYNSPRSITLSGDRATIARLEKDFAKNGVFARQLKVDVAYHSPYMDLITDDYRRSVQHICPSSEQSTVKMFSTVTGDPIDPSKMNPDYWIDNMYSLVKFMQAVKSAFPLGKSMANQQAFDAVIEIRPHAVLKGPLQQILEQQYRKDDIFYTSMLVRDQDALKTSLEAAGSL